MKRQNMKTNSRAQVNRSILSGNIACGRVRFGMHQKSQMEYLQSFMTAGTKEPEPEPVDEALEIPEEVVEMIPPETEDAPEPVTVAADEQVWDHIGSSETGEPEPEHPEEVRSVDYSGETVPLLSPVTGGVDCDPQTLIYDRGDGRVRVIPDPLGLFTDKGIRLFFPEVKNPSANVAARN